MTMQALNISKIEPIWQEFHKAIPDFGVIHTQEQYNRLVEVLNNLLDVVGDNENHPMAQLLEVIGGLIESYEDNIYPIQDATPQEALKFLMHAHNLKQADLAEDFGGQSVVSQVLNGDRNMNVRQAKALAKRFGVNVSVFI